MDEKVRNVSPTKISSFTVSLFVVVQFPKTVITDMFLQQFNPVYSSLFRAKASGGHSEVWETRDAQFLQEVTRFALIGVGPAAALQVSPSSDTCQSVAILMNRRHSVHFLCSAERTEYICTRTIILNCRLCAPFWPHQCSADTGAGTWQK